jgi:hypothetical protein
MISIRGVGLVSFLGFLDGLGSLACSGASSPRETGHLSNTSSASDTRVTVQFVSTVGSGGWSLDCRPRGSQLVIGRGEVMTRLIQYDFPNEHPARVVQLDLSDFGNLSSVKDSPTFLAVDLRADEGEVVAKRSDRVDTFCVDIDPSQGQTRITITHYMSIVE